jgi:HK97 family phage major capsid protein
MEQHKFEALLEERAGLHKRMTEINDAAEGESRDLSTEEAQEYDRVEADFDSLSVRIKRAEKLERNTPTLTHGHPSPGDEGDEERAATVDSDEYRDAFGAYLRGGLGERSVISAEQRSILKIGEDAEGGYTVPEEWAALYEPLLEAGTIRSLAEVITTTGGNPLHIPKVTEDATAPEIEGETDTIADDAETFGEVILGAFKYAQIVKASDEMARDTAIDLNAFVGRRAGFRIGRKQNADFITGAGGSTAPAGLFKGAQVGKQAASKTAITPDEIIDLIYSVIAPYRRGAVYLANDKTHAVVRKFKDKNEQYLWQPSLQAGEPDMLNGFPFYADPDINATFTEKQLVMGFGNVKLAYTIRDAGGVEVKFLDQLYAASGQVGWRVQQRSDGDIIDSAAFKTLKLGE